MQHRSLIVLSSPIYKESERMMILYAKSAETNEPHFALLDFATACDACIDANPNATSGGSGAAENEIFFCAHRLDNVSELRSKRGERTLKDIMPRPAFDTEIAGIQQRHEQVLFARTALEAVGARVMDAPAEIALQTIFIGVDPSGGQGAGKYGLVAFYFTPRRYELGVSTGLPMCACACACACASIAARSISSQRACMRSQTSQRWLTANTRCS